MNWPIVLCLSGASRRCLIDAQRRYNPNWQLEVPNFPAIRHLVAPEEGPNRQIVKIMESTPGEVKHWPVEVK